MSLSIISIILFALTLVLLLKFIYELKDSEDIHSNRKKRTKIIVYGVLTSVTCISAVIILLIFVFNMT